MSKLLSIVIPTKNRYFTLINLVEKLLTWDSDDYEVVVQDNSEDNSDIIDFLKNYENNKILRYFHNPIHVTVTQNAEDAIDNSVGDFVCFLGDDDGIVKQSLVIVRWMKENQVDSLNCKQGAFNWPEFRYKTSGKKKSLAGMLVYHSHSGSIEPQNIMQGLDNLLQNGCLEINGIARLYHGIVARRVLNELKSETGTYFPGPIADMSSAIGLTFFAKKHYYLHFPIIISGASGASYAGKSGTKKNTTSFEHQPWFSKKTLVDWSKQLPKRIVAQTVWPESAIQTLKSLGHEELISKINFPLIYASYIVDFPEFKGELEDFINENYSFNEASEIRKKMLKYKKQCRRGKLRYWVKAYAIYFGIEKVLKIEVVDANSIADALTKLETAIETNKTYKNSDFYRILNQN